ncbi:hypothetical protein [Actinoplanes sp. URMC 104]|uniref:hypothetical protein n=1 Tax=Actinoplanes sp. URMC 104 TaxID=3423409 RepID=UPI003F1B7887
MSHATYAPTAGGHDDHTLAAFLATVPAAAAYDLTELLRGPRRAHRPARRAARARAIDLSQREG